MCQDRLPRCCPPTASSDSPRGSRPTLPPLVLPAWDEFLAIAAELDLDGPTRLDGWQARHVCVHLGTWPGSRSLQRMREEAEQDELAAADWADHRAATFDQDSHNEAVLEARRGAPRSDVLAALQESRDEVAAYFASGEAGELGLRRVRSVLGPLPLGTLVAAGAYELAVHTLDLAPAGCPEAVADPARRPGWRRSSTPPAGWPPGATSRPAPAASRRRAAGPSPRCRTPGPPSSCPPCRRPGRSSRAAPPTCSTPPPGGGPCRRCWPGATCGCTT